MADTGFDDKLTVDSEGGSTRVHALSSPEEKRLVRRLDWRILPLLWCCYLFSFLDRGNIGNARLQGLDEVFGPDGDKTGAKFDWVVSAFYFAIILCQIPATILFKLFRPSIWMATAVMGWGIAATLMGTSYNMAGLVVSRVFLGAFDAGFGPILPLYLSMFYTKDEMATRVAIWISSGPFASAFGGLIAFGVQHIRSSIAHWRLLFIIEGVPTILLALCALNFPDRPEKTKFFSKEERVIALDRMNRGTSGDHGATINRSHIYAAFSDWRVYVGGVMYFSLNCALTSLSAFLPTINKTFGYSNAIAQLLTVPPYAVTTVTIVVTCLLSDRIQQRGILMSIMSSIGGIGYLLFLFVPHNNHVRYFATFLITSGTYASIGLTLAWYSHNLGSETKRAAGIAIILSIGQCGSILGSHIYPKTEGPRYIKGYGMCCALEFLVAVCGIILSMSYRSENKQRDREHGVPVPDAKVDTSVLADKAHDFRYVP